MSIGLFEPEVLNVYAKHYQTDEVIPAGLVEKMDKSGKYGQGFATAEYLAASLLDMDYHVLKKKFPMIWTLCSSKQKH